MKHLVATAVRRPVGVSIIFLAIALFGIVSLNQLAVDLLPEVDVPRISITTQYEGVAPEEIETLITRPVEQATSTIQGVDRIEATSSEGLSRVQLQFTWGTQLDEALDDVRVAVDRLRVRLPEEAEPPSIYKFDLASVPVAFLGLTGSGDPRRLKYLAEEDLSRALERVPGVASVNVNGGRDREIRIALDSNRLAAYQISAEQVAQALARENQTVSAGDVRDAGRVVVIRTAGEFTSLDEIRGVVVATREQTPIRVSDLGAVLDTIRQVKSELWIDGEPGIRLRVYKQSGANTVEVAKALAGEIERINAKYAGAVKLSVIWDSSDFIKAAVTNVQSSAAIGAVLAAIVLLFFLRSWRATLVVGLAIPLSVAATFGLMHSQGMTLNVISFGGLALGLGMLVDAAIVILENIHHKRKEERDARKAAIEGTGEVGSAVVAGTLTTVAVFVPVVFVGGFAGVFFGEMAAVVTFALLCSLAVALTLVPMLSARLLGPEHEGSGGAVASLGRAIGARLDRMDAVYARVIRSSLAAPWAIVVGAVVLLGSSLVLTTRLGFELMPTSDEGRIEIDLEMPVGTPLDTTSETILKIERIVRSTLAPGELRHVVTTAGPETWWRPGGSHEGEVDLMLAPIGERQRSIDEVERGIRQAVEGIPWAKLQVRQRSSNILVRIVRRGDDRLGVEIRGHDLETADALAQRVVEVLDDVPGVTFVRPDREIGQIERVLHVDRARAAELGLGSADVAAAVEHYVLGRVATRYRDQGDEFDIRVGLLERDRERLEQLPSLPIVTPSGERVALHSLVTFEERRGPSSISRINQERSLRVNVGTGDRPLGDIARDVERQLATITIPEGFSVGMGGETSEQEGTFMNLLLGIVLACFLVYAAMAVQFESVRHPLVVMLAVPFAFIGVILALVITGTTFNMNSFLGSIILVGIVVNNAIVLVDYTNLLRRQHGMGLTEAVIDAATRRLRPILMTTLTTVLALLPLALAVTEGSEIQAPLARAVVGGLITSSFVTLLLVPCVYYLVERRRSSEPTPAAAALSKDAERAMGAAAE